VERSRVFAHQRSESEIERQRKRLQDQAQSRRLQNQKTLLKVMAIGVATLGIVGVTIMVPASRSVLKKALAKVKNAVTHQVPTNGSPNDQTFSGNAVASAPTQPLITKPPDTGTKVVQDNPVNPAPNPEGFRFTEMPPPTAYDVPSGWTPLRIGGLSYSHAEYHTNKQQIRFDLSVGGGGFRADGDDFFFVCKTNVTKESTFTATLFKIDPPSTSSICGIMMRATKTVNSSFLFIGASSKQFLVYLREATGGPISESQADRSGRLDPVTLKFREKDGVFTPDCSISGWKWTVPKKFALNGNLPTLVGLAVCSGSTSNTMAQFVNVSDNDPVKKMNS
jgi:hypothetical protein